MTSIGREIDLRSNVISKINSHLYMEENDQQKAIFVGILKKHWCELRFDRKHKSAIGIWNSKHCCKCILRLDNSWELPCFED